MALFDRVKVAVNAAPGTGNIALGAAVPGFRSFSGAGVPDGTTVSYVLEDGTAFEFGRGTFSASNNTLTRAPIASSAANGTDPIPASISSVVYITILSSDLASGPTYKAHKSWRVRFLAIAAAGHTAGLGRIAFLDANGAVIDTTGGAASASSTFNDATNPATYAASQCFDSGLPNNGGDSDQPGSGWYATSGNVVNEYVAFTFTSAKAVAAIRLICAGDSTGVSDAPTTFAIDASDDNGSTWNTVGQFAAGAWANGVSQTFAMSPVATGSYPLLTELTMTARKTLDGAGQATFMTWQQIVEDAVGAFSASASTRLTVPNGYTKVRFNIYMAFVNEGYATAKGIQLNKNGNPLLLDLKPTQYEGNCTMQTRWLRVIPGDYFEAAALTYGGASSVESAGPADYMGPPAWQAEWRVS